MENQVFLTLLSTVFVFLCGCCIAESGRRNSAKEKGVYLPQFLLWLGVIDGVLFLAFGWIAAREDGSLGLTVCLGAFVLLGMLLMLGWKNCFIVYDKEGFTQRNLVGMRRRFTYEQVTGWSCNERNPMESTLCVAGKKVPFNLTSKNGPEFLAAVGSAYRRIHGKQNMPEIPALRKERGGFCAHVYNPGEYLLVFLMMVAMVVGFGAWLAIDSWMPITEQDGQEYALTFCAWELEEDDLKLTSPQTQELYWINGCEDYVQNLDALIEKCDGKTTFTVWAERFTPKEEDPFYRVYALSSGTEVYRTFADSTAYRRENIPGIAALFGVFLLIVLAFSGFIYMVGSDPQRFPKWVVYACFKKNAIDLD